MADTPTNGNGRDPLPRAEFWQRVAGFTFGVWALMVPVGVLLIRSAFNDLATANASVATSLIDYKLATERRITLLEERQLLVITHNAEQDARLRSLEQIVPPPLLRR